jgi:hypothetical protein
LRCMAAFMALVPCSRARATAAMDAEDRMLEEKDRAGV